MTSIRIATACLSCLLAATVATAEPPDPRVAHVQSRDAGLSALRNLSSAIETLSATVLPSVVQVVVTAYTAQDAGDSGTVDLVMSRQRRIGSGVVVDANGYRHECTRGGRRTERAGRCRRAAREKSRDDRRRRARIDLALLKVELTDLPALRFADAASVRQGELVFAFGSPQGLQDSVTMGVVSATGRQPDPDAPTVYIQTDAPINRGNSGGPLVNAAGELVGINTFILSNSGGNEGLGFAIPSTLVAMAYPKLREYGHLHRGQIGVLLQTITPMLAEGLGLLRDRGVIVADITSGSPADAAGLRIGDVIDSVDGEPVDDLLPIAMRLFTSNGSESVMLGVVRGELRFTAEVAVDALPNDVGRLTDLVDPTASAVPDLGILGVGLTAEVAALLPSLRSPVGVVVAARAPQGGPADVTLLTGDVIHASTGFRSRASTPSARCWPRSSSAVRSSCRSSGMAS